MSKTWVDKEEMNKKQVEYIIILTIVDPSQHTLPVYRLIIYIFVLCQLDAQKLRSVARKIKHSPKNCFIFSSIFCRPSMYV